MKVILLITILAFGLHAAGTLEEIQRSCDADDGISCTNLGILYQVGKDINKSNEKAKVYYGKACKLKDAEGCVMLGDLFYYGEGVDQNNSEAKLYYDKACKMSNKQGCKNLQKIKDEEKALQEKKDELKRLKQEQEELLQEADLLDKI